jgi:starvation-inducible DNA-binding protein
MKIDIGISEKNREEIAEGLSRFLTDTYALYLKTHNFHWNVEGPMFNTLHLMFEQQYNEIWMAIDGIAERIRALGFHVSSDFAQYKNYNATLKDREMLKELVLGQESVIKTAREIFKIADSVSDQPTIDLLTRRMEVHEKNAWMLRSLLN